jgi:hypothetical protein
VPVSPADTAAELAARVLAVEHLLLPRAVHAVAAGAVSLDAEGRARAVGHASPLAFALGDLDAAARSIHATLATPAADPTVAP